MAWTPDRLWSALLSDDKERVAATVDCGLSNVYARVRRFRATSPGGSGLRHVVDRDVHRLMARMLDGARFEALAAVAIASPSPRPVFDHLLAAAGNPRSGAPWRRLEDPELPHVHRGAMAPVHDPAQLPTAPRD